MRTLHISGSGKIKPANVTRHELIAKFGIHQRDLRPLILLNQTPTILTRSACYIVNLGFLRLIIGEKDAYIFNNDHRYVAGHFVEDLSKRFLNLQTRKHKYSRFAYMVLESALHVKMDKMMHDYTRLATDIEQTFARLEVALSNEALEQLLAQKKRLSRMDTTVQQMQSLLHDILDDEDELQHFVLATTAQANADEEEEEIESIIEHYDEQVDHVWNKILDLKENIEDTQSIANLKMGSVRNTLIKLDLFFTIFAASLAFPTLIAGIFGMNIVNSFENNFTVFLLLCSVALLSSIVVLCAAWIFIRKRKVL